MRASARDLGAIDACPTYTPLPDVVPAPPRARPLDVRLPLSSIVGKKERAAAKRQEDCAEAHRPGYSGPPPPKQVPAPLEAVAEIEGSGKSE